MAGSSARGLRYLVAKKKPEFFLTSEFTAPIDPAAMGRAVARHIALEEGTGQHSQAVFDGCNWRCRTCGHIVDDA